MTKKRKSLKKDLFNGPPTALLNENSGVEMESISRTPTVRMGRPSFSETSEEIGVGNRKDQRKQEYLLIQAFEDKWALLTGAVKDLLDVGMIVILYVHLYSTDYSFILVSGASLGALLALLKVPLAVMQFYGNPHWAQHPAWRMLLDLLTCIVPGLVIPFYTFMVVHWELWAYLERKCPIPQDTMTLLLILKILQNVVYILVRNLLGCVAASRYAKWKWGCGVEGSCGCFYCIDWECYRLSCHEYVRMELRRIFSWLSDISRFVGLGLLIVYGLVKGFDKLVNC